MAVLWIVSLLLAQPLLALALLQINDRGLPADPTGVQEIISKNGARITFKQPGKEGLCETTADNYAGYIRLNEKYGERCLTIRSIGHARLNSETTIE